MIKKILSVCVALMMGLCLFCGCGDSGEIDYLKDYDKGNQLRSVKAETEGTLYSLEKAYEIGFLSQRDLKKISYFHDADNHATYPVGLFNSVEEAIKNTYAEEWNADERNSEEATAEDFTVRSFYGYYYKCCVITVDSTLWNYPTDVPNYYEEIGGVQFHFTDHGGLTVWIPNSYFYTLDEAYNYGWLSDNDVRSIAYYYYERYQSVNLDEYGTPKPKDPESLSWETQQQMKETFLEFLTHIMRVSDPIIDGVNFYAYYGTYGDCVVVGITYDYKMVDPVFENEHKIGNVTFHRDYVSWYLKVWNSKLN